MPIYEYVAEEDGEVIELVRSMADADAPVEDPAGRERTFRRRMSIFAPKSNTQVPLPVGGACPCGKTDGGCGAA